MKLKDVMTTHVRGISAEQNVQQAAEAMSELSVGSLPVFRNGRVVGIVTDRDITLRAVACGCDCSQKPVGEIMSSDLCTLSENTTVKAAVDEMERRQIRRILVTGDHETIVGIVSIGDIAAKSSKEGFSAELIKKVSQPCEPTRSPV